MANVINLSGKTFGRLSVVMQGPRDHRNEAKWICSCVCGGQRLVPGSLLRTGVVSSCGCVNKARTHGESGTALYNIWNSMRMRCRPQYWEHQHYYDRGITVCDRWNSYAAFKEDMGDRPSRLLSLDRIDVNKGYAPDNCRWATSKEQAVNRQNTIYLEVDGKRLTLAEVSGRLGISVGALKSRIGNGWPLARILSPNQKPNLRSDKWREDQNGWVSDYTSSFLSLPT